MSSDLDATQLAPGDVLLYWTPGLFSLVIGLKTWHRVSHVETYIGQGRSIASRNGIGVGTYPLRLDGLVCVRRPMWVFNLPAVLRWQETVQGQGYDWRGLLAFIGLREMPDDQMFCSEHATYAARHSGGQPFDGDEPAEVIAPSAFLLSPEYVTAWRRP